MVPGRGHAEKTPHLLYTEDGWEAVCGLGPHEVESLPVARQDGLEEKSDAAGADAHGVRRESIDVFSMQDVLLELGFGDEVR